MSLWYSYGIPATRVVAFTYEADYHCVACTIQRFGKDESSLIPESARDSEGNEIHAVFASDMDVETVAACSDCGGIICLACGEVDIERTESETRIGRKIGAPCWNCATEWHIQGE